MRLVSYEQAAAISGKSMRTVFRWCKEGKFRTVQQDGRTLVELEDGDDPLTTATDTAARLTQVAGAAAIQRTRDSDILTLVVTDARRSKRGAWTVAAVMSLGVAGIWGQYTHETRKLDRQLVSAQHQRDAAVARASVADRRASEAEAETDRLLDAHLESYGLLAGR